MTPERIELSRQLLKLPGFPHDPPSGQLRTSDGMDWCYSDEADWNAGGSGRQVPNLEDAATGGVLLAWLAPLVHPDVQCKDTYRVIFAIDNDLKRFVGATLAEACARALVAIGRCA